MGRSSGLWPRPSAQGVCVYGVRLVCSSLLSPDPSPRSPTPALSPLSLTFHLPTLHLPPSSPSASHHWALQPRVKLPVPRHLCAPTVAVRWGEGGQGAMGQELQKAD